jgi:hypothetical protein
MLHWQQGKTGIVGKWKYIIIPKWNSMQISHNLCVFQLQVKTFLETSFFFSVLVTVCRTQPYVFYTAGFKVGRWIEMAPKVSCLFKEPSSELQYVKIQLTKLKEYRILASAELNIRLVLLTFRWF